MEIISKTERTSTTLTCIILGKVVVLTYESVAPETPIIINVSCQLDFDPSIGSPVPMMSGNVLNMTISGLNKSLNIQGSKYTIADLSDLITTISVEVATLMSPTV